jgi:hypothetical protein
MNQGRQSKKNNQSSNRAQDNHIQDIEFEEVNDDASDKEFHEDTKDDSGTLDMVLFKKRSSKNKSSITVMTISITIECR